MRLHWHASFYSDPDVIKLGNDFFMIASSFNCIPGIPLLHSKEDGAECIFSWSVDNVNYNIIGSPFRAVPGVWIGSKVGVFCVNMNGETSRGYADFDWFRIG